MPLVRIIRALDGILFCLFALAFLALWPTAGRDLLGQHDMICVLPVFVLAWCALGIPGEFEGLPPWPGQVRRLRASVLCSAGLSPFLVWWLRRTGDNYLLTNALLDLLAGACALFFLVVIGEQLCRFLGLSGLGWEARFTKGLVFWLMIVVGIGGLAVFLLISMVVFPANTPGETLAQFVGLSDLPLEIGERWSRLPGLVALFLALAPLVFAVSLIVRLRFALLQRLGEKLGEEP